MQSFSNNFTNSILEKICKTRRLQKKIQRVRSAYAKFLFFSKKNVNKLKSCIEVSYCSQLHLCLTKISNPGFFMFDVKHMKLVAVSKMQL